MDAIKPIALPELDLEGFPAHQQLAGAAHEYNVLAMMRRELPDLYEARQMPSKTARSSARQLQAVVDSCAANAQGLKQIAGELDGPWAQLAEGLSELYAQMAVELDFRFVHGSGELIEQLSRLPAAGDELLSLAGSLPAPQA